jgi:hypothetical protein
MSSLLIALSEYTRKIRKACKANKTFRVNNSPFPFLLSKGPKHEIFGCFAIQACTKEKNCCKIEAHQEAEVYTGKLVKTNFHYCIGIRGTVGHGKVAIVRF